MAGDLFDTLSVLEGESIGTSDTSSICGAVQAVSWALDAASAVKGVTIVTGGTLSETGT